MEMNVEQQEVSLNENNPIAVQKPKKNGVIILGILFLLMAIAIGSYFLGISTKNKSNYQASQQPSSLPENLSPTVMNTIPTASVTIRNNPNPAPPSPLIYSKLAKYSNQNTLAQFEDPLLHVSFMYQSSYIQDSLKADSKNMSAYIYFLKEKNDIKEKNIKDEIGCTISNRNYPSGVCSEGTLSDADFFIIVPQKIPAYDEDQKSDYHTCIKEELSSSKIVYSCSGIISANGSYGNIYNVYLTVTTKTYLLRIVAPDALKVPDLITKAIDSFEVK